jgi:hypothetical protein
MWQMMIIPECLTTCMTRECSVFAASFFDGMQPGPSWVLTHRCGMFRLLVSGGLLLAEPKFGCACIL